MKLQQLIFKVEELKALVDMYEKTQQAVARATVMQDSVDDTVDEETRVKVSEGLAQLSTRLEHLEDMLLSRTRTSAVDEAVDTVQEHIARVQLFQNIRGEQLNTRTQLDLELSRGGLPQETRQQVEAQLGDMQMRLDTLVQQGQDALGGPALVLV